MVPPDAALLSLLTLKLLDKERRSHIDDFNFDQAAGLFSGLNILPKKSFITDYITRFVEFWQQLTGHDPQWLYFDSKLTTYAELSRLNQRGGVHFVTIRRRGPALLGRIRERPESDWTPTSTSFTWTACRVKSG